MNDKLRNLLKPAAPVEDKPTSPPEVSPDSLDAPDGCGRYSLHPQAGVMLKTADGWIGMYYAHLTGGIHLASDERSIRFQFDDYDGTKNAVIVGSGLFEVARHLTAARRETLHPGRSGVVTAISVEVVKEEKKEE